MCSSDLSCALHHIGFVKGHGAGHALCGLIEAAATRQQRQRQGKTDKEQGSARLFERHEYKPVKAIAQWKNMPLYLMAIAAVRAQSMRKGVASWTRSMKSKAQD